MYRKNIIKMLGTAGVVLGVLGIAGITVGAENKFPEIYECNMESVNFCCELNLPTDFDEKKIQKAMVDQVYYSEYEKALAYLGAGKEVAEEYIYPAQDDIHEWRYYVFSDGATMTTGDTTSFSTLNSEHYLSVFSKLASGQGNGEIMELGFASPEDSSLQLLDVLKNIGLDWNGELFCYALGYEEARNWEEHLGQEGGFDQSRYKQDWSNQDDAYLFYGYQEHQGLPVYHELMFIGGNMKYMNADNAVIQAVITSTGIQKLYVNYLYDLIETGEVVEFKPFDEIASTVAFKLQQNLTGEQYEVTKAILTEMVRHSQEQTYEVLPVWYVEAEYQSGTTAILVNAETAEEIFVR